ncbi:MAG: DUF4340 domain-containing protein, partial [Polyangiaceae bacterium]
MNTRGAATPLVLVALAVSTAAYAYFIDRGRISDADRDARRRDVFPSFRVEDVRLVKMTHGAETLVLDRGGKDSTWEITSPRREATDPATVDALLRELEMATRVRDVPAGDALGLSAPRARGEIQMGSIDYRFELGAEAPQPEGAAYMRLDGSGTFVAGRSLAVQLMRGADAYRERTIVAYGESDALRLEVHPRAGAGFAIERHGASFRLTKGGLRASRDAVDQVFGALADARADSFLDDEQAAPTVADPALVAVLTPRDPTRAQVTLLVGGVCPSDAHDVVVVRTSPTRVSACVAGEVLEALRTAPDALGDRGLFFAHPDEMEELRIDPGDPKAPR